MAVADNITNDMREQLRRMVNEPEETTYGDDELDLYIAKYPVLDPRGEEAFTWDTSTSPPTVDDNDDWIATFDLHAAAADIWEEKAAVIAADFTFSADGASYNRSEASDRFMKLSNYHRARRRAKAGTMVSWPQQSAESLSDIIGNLAEDDD